MNSIINCCKQIDTKKAYQLLIGVLGINVAYLIVGIQYEKITKLKYKNSETDGEDVFRLTAGYILIERSINWILGVVYKQMTLPKQGRVNIAAKNAAFTGFFIYFSNVIQTQCMYLVSFPFIIMAKSCSLLNVILVGLFCSRVRSKQLKLSNQKIIIAIIVTVGIIMFRVFDPTMNFSDNKNTQLLGILFLLISLFTDGFIPDFQAQIKQKFKPSSVEMLVEMNKWSAICALVQLTVTGHIVQFYNFFMTHPQFVKDLLTMSVAAFVGQVFIYRLIKEFKQHLVPFVVTTRKIITVGLSLVYFHHETNLGQVGAIVCVFLATVYEFLDSIWKKDGQKGTQTQNMVAIKQEQQKQAINQSTQQQNVLISQTNYQNQPLQNNRK